MNEEVGDRAPRETGMSKEEVVVGKAHRFSDLFAAYSFDPAHDQPTYTRTRASSHSFSSRFLPESSSSDSASNFTATSVKVYKYRGSGLRRASSVPSLSLSAGCSPEGSVLGSPKLGSIAL
ncbi:hypothetical protein CNBG_9506 [Cryptococcus deuterogattii R265]|nr:hypothetical protein CNBG_9506 [Cryptococcus deuterogattii R265]